MPAVTWGAFATFVQQQSGYIPTPQNNQATAGLLQQFITAVNGSLSDPIYAGDLQNALNWIDQQSTAVPTGNPDQQYFVPEE